jgi:hypothetical protein
VYEPDGDVAEPVAYVVLAAAHRAQGHDLVYEPDADVAFPVTDHSKGAEAVCEPDGDVAFPVADVVLTAAGRAKGAEPVCEPDGDVAFPVADHSKGAEPVRDPDADVANPFRHVLSGDSDSAGPVQDCMSVSVSGLSESLRTHGPLRADGAVPGQKTNGTSR